MNFFDQQINLYGNIDWDIIDSILKSDDFIKNSKKHNYLYKAIYNQESNLSEEELEKNNLFNKRFFDHESMLIKASYPELSESYVITVVNMCSRHESAIFASIDRDLCVISAVEGIEEYKETYKNAISMLKTTLATYLRNEEISTSNQTEYSEERVALLVIGQLQKHLNDSSNPILTWGTARLVLSELCSINMNKKSQSKA